MRRLGGIDASPASLAVFNHAILYVPAHDLFLDGTAEFHGSGELPGDDRGAEVLVVEPAGGSKFYRTPDATPSDNLDEPRISAKLLPDGSAAMQVTGSARGAWTAELRRTFESADERQARAQEQLARAAFPNVKVTAGAVSDPPDIEKALETRITATATGVAHAEGAGVPIRPLGPPPRFAEAYAQLS